MKLQWRSPRGRYVIALILASLASVGLFGYGALQNHVLAATYLPWNLFLAWVPMLISVRLIYVLENKPWSSWEALITSLLWLVFLPNSFYLISDFIHLQEVEPAHVLYDTVMFASFVGTGVVLGFSSLYLVHSRLKRFVEGGQAAFLVGVTLLFCSVAIYIGRDLRWNTWDILVNPAGLLFDIADRLEHPSAYPHMLLAIGAFFVLLASMYNLVWQGVQLFVAVGDDI